MPLNNLAGLCQAQVRFAKAAHKETQRQEDHREDVSGEQRPEVVEGSMKTGCLRPFPCAPCFPWSVRVWVPTTGGTEDTERQLWVQWMNHTRIQTGRSSAVLGALCTAAVQRAAEDERAMWNARLATWIDLGMAARCGGSCPSRTDRRLATYPRLTLSAAQPLWNPLNGLPTAPLRLRLGLAASRCPGEIDREKIRSFFQKPHRSLRVSAVVEKQPPKKETKQLTRERRNNENQDKHQSRHLRHSA
jgi:hypothetical protein